MQSFTHYMRHQDDEIKERLKIVGTIFKKGGFEVKPHLEDINEPYLYVRTPLSLDPILENLSFGGIRIYTRGKDLICYRIQNEENTEPYGSSYQLDLKSMFKQYLPKHKKEAVGHELIRFLISEVKTFFIRSAHAEKDQNVGDIDTSQMGSVVVNASGTDYANTVSNVQGSSPGHRN